MRTSTRGPPRRRLARKSLSGAPLNSSAPFNAPVNGSVNVPVAGTASIAAAGQVTDQLMVLDMGPHAYRHQGLTRSKRGGMEGLPAGMFSTLRC